MKKIQLKQVTKDGQVIFDYKAVLQNILANAPAGEHFTLDQIRQSVRVLDRIEAANPGMTIHVEDAEHQFIVAMFNRTKWAHASRELLGFIDDVMNAETYQPTEKPARA